MNKLITKIVGAALGLTMAVGVGIAIGASRSEAVPVRADGESTYTIGWGTASGTSGTFTNFTTTSGTVNGILSWTSNKNSSSSNPAYNSSNNELRLYYNSGGAGGSITITPASGITFTGFSMTTSTTPSVKYKVNGGTATAVSQSESVYTATGFSATTSLEIQNVNTSNTQLRIKTIALTYTSSGGDTPTKYSVTYANGGATSGIVPTDSNEYDSGDTVTVLGQGTLSKTNYDFAGWSDGTNTYVENDTFTISSNITLTAQWNYSNHYTDDTTASTITWDLTNPEYMSAGTDQMSWSSPKATMVADKAESTTNTNNYCPPSNSSTRFYKDSTLTITPVSGYQINSVVFTATSNNYATALGNSTWSNATSSVENSTVTVTPTDKKSSFVATIGAATGISTVVVNYSVASYDPVVTLSTYSVTMLTTDTEGVSVTATVENVASPNYVWSSNDANITLDNTTSATVTIYPDTDVAGSANVHLVVGGATPNLTADVTVTINEPGPGETIETPYTVSEARSAIDAGEGVTDVYATGIVSEIVSEYNSTYHNVTFNMSADGLTTSNQLEAYHCGGTDAEFVSVGDTVVIYGSLTKYNSTYEFGSGCEIVSRITPWGFDRLELVASAEYDNTYYKDSEFSSDGLTVNYVEVNSNTSAERTTDVTAGATWNVDLTSTGSKSLSASYGGHTSNSISIIVVEKPSYDIAFGSASGSTKIDSTSITANDWTVTTVGTSSFTQNSSYSQVGSSSSPATSITFTKTINSVVTIKAFFIDLGGFNNTAGTVTLQVGSTTVGTGSLSGGSDVTVSASSHGRGTGLSTVLTITITDIAKGVKVYGIAYTAKTDSEMVEGFISDYLHMDHTTNDGSCKTEGWYSAAKIEYGKLHADQKSLFNTDSTYADAKARLIAWATANGETFDPAAYTFTKNSNVTLISVVANNSETTSIIIVVISMISLTAIGGFFFIKKRKEQ